MKLALFFILLQATAYAGVTSTRTLDEIKAACSDPASVGNQIAPSSIKIFCSEEKNGWEASEEGGTLSEATYDLVSSFVTTNKPDIGSDLEQKSYDSPPSILICPKYQEFVLIANQNIFVTCAEVAEMTDINLFCKDSFAAQSADNPNFYTKTLTGKTKDTCVGAGTFGAPVQEPPKRLGQR